MYAAGRKGNDAPSIRMNDMLHTLVPEEYSLCKTQVRAEDGWKRFMMIVLKIVNQMISCTVHSIVLSAQTYIKFHPGIFLKLPCSSSQDFSHRSSCQSLAVCRRRSRTSVKVKTLITNYIVK